MVSLVFNIGNNIRPDMSDLRFEATAKKKQVITCKRSRVRNKMHGKKEEKL